MKNSVDEKYLGLVNKILKEGKPREDRTGTGTMSIFCPSILRFDLSEGFPLLSLKKTNFDLVFGELMWMMVDGSTSNTELEKKYGVKFWKPWEDKNGDLPNIYGKQVTRSEGEVRVVPVQVRRKKKSKVEYPLFPLVECDKELLESNNYGKFRVISDIKRIYRYGKLEKVADIQFLLTGNIKKDVSYGKIVRGQVRDEYYPKVRGVGFVGDYNIDTDEDKKLRKVWEEMLSRCYYKKAKYYENYGGKGVFVDSRWHNFSNFVKDVKKLTNWQKKREFPNGYELDKDYYGSNCYSRETCVWLSKKDNRSYSRFKPFKVTDSDGREYLFISQADAADMFGVTQQHISLNMGEGVTKKGLRFDLLGDTKEYVFRYQLPVNQMERVINEIRENPNSRRLVIDNWSAYDLEHQALPACHSFVQFYVHNGRLSCSMYQRSVDVMLGLPYNIAFYSLLTHMIAHVTGLEVGEFIHIGGDTHIYSNLESMAKEVTRRKPRKSPKLYIKRSVKDISEFTLEDFVIEGYKPHPKIQGEVSV